MAARHRQSRRRRRTQPPPLDHHRPNVIQAIDTAVVVPPSGDMTIKGRQRGRLNCCVSLHIDCPGGCRITASSIVPRVSTEWRPTSTSSRPHVRGSGVVSGYNASDWAKSANCSAGRRSSICCPAIAARSSGRLCRSACPSTADAKRSDTASEESSIATVLTVTRNTAPRCPGQHRHFGELVKGLRS